MPNKERCYASGHLHRSNNNPFIGVCRLKRWFFVAQVFSVVILTSKM